MLTFIKYLYSKIFKKKIKIGMTSTTDNLNISYQQLFNAMDLLEGCNFYRLGNKGKKVYECVRVHTEDNVVMYTLENLTNPGFKMMVTGEILRQQFIKIDCEKYAKYKPDSDSRASIS